MSSSALKVKKSVQEKKSTRFLNYTLHRAIEVALYYGFTPTTAPRITKSDQSLAKTMATPENGTEHSALAHSAEEKIALLREYTDQYRETGAQPILRCYESRSNKMSRICLDILGTHQAIAEAILIQTALSMLSEEGFDNLSVELNSLGDRDSWSRFSREAVAHFRKHVNEMSATIRQVFKRDPHELYGSEDPESKKLVEHAPRPISFLSEPSRIHFKELLEYLESGKINYQIKHTLLSGRQFCTHTVFEIKGTKPNEQTEITLAAGLRYNCLSRKMGLRKEVGAAGVTICLSDAKERTSRGSAKSAWRFRKPLCYFIHMGPEAKQKSLKLIEALRKARIAVYHSLMKDKLVAQLALAESLKVPYVIIMGQKEAMEGSTIVRAMETRSQETIRLEHLPTYLKEVL